MKEYRRMSQARFVQEWVLDRRGRFEDNVKQAEKAYLYLSTKGYGADELIEKPDIFFTDKDGNSYTLEALLNGSVTGGSDD